MVCEVLPEVLPSTSARWVKHLPIPPNVAAGGLQERGLWLMLLSIMIQGKALVFVCVWTSAERLKLSETPLCVQRSVYLNSVANKGLAVVSYGHAEAALSKAAPLA